MRKNPERVLDVLLPSFDVILGVLRPLTAGMLRVGTNGHRRNQSGVRRSQSSVRKAANGKGEPEPPPVETAPPAAAPEVEAVQEGQARELLRTLADFRETMVREVMTPRPDIIAIDSGATIDQLYQMFREQQVLACAGVQRHARQRARLRVHQGPHSARPSRGNRRPDHAARAAGALRAGDQARARPAQGVPAPPRADRDRRR